MYFAYIKKEKAELIKLTSRLIEIPTFNPPGVNYEKMVDFIEQYCRSLGLRTSRYEVPAARLKKYNISGGSKRINLIAFWDAGAKKTLHINGHYDVVPAGSSWASDPFKAVIKNNKIYGRGSEDMKSNIAAVLFAIKALKQCGIGPGCNIELSFTPDEEIGGRTGFGYLVDKGIVAPDYAISEGYNNEFISYGNKGLAWFKIDIIGRACHSSEPYNGINAFEKMADAVKTLRQLNKKISSRKTRYKVKDARNRYSTMVLGGEIAGGAKANIVCDSCSFMIDRRFLPEENLDDVKDEITGVFKTLAKKDKQFKFRITMLSEEDSVVSDEKNALFKEFKSSINRVLKKKARCVLMAGATDIRFLIRKGVPCLGYSVYGAHTAHCDNEFIYVKSLVDTTKIFADIIYNLK
ncbi:MAG: M20 family metallopeptidase [Candidatus Omnitrophica bacterium]|nr:M20 family metallopeptidase [Candidatus Omnitrophota bacterium]